MANNKGLYHASYEHDACGIGFVANINGKKSFQTIADALTVLENMEHRGACGCENNTGDGAGIMIQTPHDFFVEECESLGFTLPEYGRYGVGVIFFPKDPDAYGESKRLFNKCADELNLKIL
jgi:glutamate synthase (NADPH/NADH) large chain